MPIPFPKAGDYAPYIATYLGHLQQPIDILAYLQSSLQESLDFLEQLPEELADSPYALGKWSYKQTYLHILDCERILGYRALAIARGDQGPYPGFDEDAYAQEGRGLGRSLDSVAEEFAALRQSHLALFASFGDLELGRSGQASGHYITVPALIHMLAGHELHHRKVLQGYLQNQKT